MKTDRGSFVSFCRSLVQCTCPIVCTLLLTACGSSDDAPSVPSAQFSNLGVPSGYVSSQASAVSADGSVIVGTAATTDGNTQAIRWSEGGGARGLGFLPGGVNSNATGVSADGSVVVGSGDTSSAPATPVSAFRWVEGTGLLRVAPIPGSYLCTAAGVSGDGTTITGTCLTTNNEAFRWTQETGSTGLGRFGGGSNQTSSATAISSDGAVIVGAGHPVLTGAVLWPTGASGIVLGKLPRDTSATALATSRDGAVVVGISIDNAQIPHAFRWTPQDGMQALETASSGFTGSVAAAVSHDGTTVVGWATMATGETAVIWTAERGLRPLDAMLASDYRTEIPAGWSLNRATAISADGRKIAGHGKNPRGQTEAWSVELPD